jgi:hypothetical protein
MAGKVGDGALAGDQRADEGAASNAKAMSAVSAPIPVAMTRTGGRSRCGRRSYVLDR